MNTRPLALLLLACEGELLAPAPLAASARPGKIVARTADDLPAGL